MIIRGIGTAETLGGPVTPLVGGTWDAHTQCPNCNAEVPLSNLSTAPMPGGGNAVFFASTEEERQEAITLLGALREGEPSFTSTDELASYIEEVAPRLDSLADWIRSHQDALISALIPTLVALLLAIIQDQQGISGEELEEILEKHSTPKVVIVDDDSNESKTGPRQQGQRKRQPGGRSGPRNQDRDHDDQGDTPGQ